ncbi:MAG: hypothetical protein FWB93_06940 [Oscillospiraceae bacterium]|nr:hypothetical protein [Oscillospiraceae bacterium]
MEEFIKNIKGRKRGIWLLIGICAGVFLIILGGMGSFGNNQARERTPAIDANQQEVNPAYVHELETRVAEQLSRINGVTNVTVMLTVESGSEFVYQGSTRVRIITPTVRGVSVVAGGGDNPVLQQEIISMLSALFNLGSNRIFVGGAG